MVKTRTQVQTDLAPCRLHMQMGSPCNGYVAGTLSKIGLHPELVAGITSPGHRHLEADADPDQVREQNREGELYSSGRQSPEPLRQVKATQAGVPYRRPGSPQGSGLVNC